MSLTLEELREAVLNRLDVDDLLDIMNISAKELLYAFPDKFEEMRDKFDYIEEEVCSDSDSLYGEYDDN